MRIFTLIAFALFIIIFSDANAQTSTGGDKISYSTEISHGYIDKLNDIAENIYLTSPDSAHKVTENALLLSNKSNYVLGKGRSFLNLGTVYWAQSYFPISLFYLKSAISNLPKNQHRYLSIAYKSLGRSYADLKDYNLAFKNLDTALQYAGNDKGCAADVYGERAYVYFRLNNFKKALELAKYSLKLNKLNHDDQRTADLYGHLGNIYLHNLNYNAALAYNDSAFSMGVRLHNKRLLAYTYTSYAVAYNSLGNFNKAVNCAEKGISLAASIGILDAETKAFDALINTYILQHDYVKALEYQKRFNIIKDSLTNIAKLKTITLVQNYYSLNEKINGLTVMAVNEKINQPKIKFQHMVIQVLCISILFLAVILTATYYFYKQKKLLSNKLQHQHTELFEQKQLIELQSIDLKKANDLKDKLFAVIGHDLRSPVANLSSIIEMFDEGYLTATEVNSLMKNINPIVKGAELTLSNLIEWAGSQIKGRNLELCSVDIFLMGVEMEQTFIHSLKLKGIEFMNKAYPGKAAIADENHLKVILRNLISNAIKFTGNKGSIELTTIIEQNEVIVSVKDNGKGMAPDEINKLFYLNTHFSNSGTSGEKGTGIGLLLCKELVELNGGKLKVKSKPNKGTTFYFNLPLVKTYA